jgi:hypothetical protein
VEDVDMLIRLKDERRVEVISKSLPHYLALVSRHEVLLPPSTFL